MLGEGNKLYLISALFQLKDVHIYYLMSFSVTGCISSICFSFPLHPLLHPSSWGRWKDILNHGRFKWHLAERDMEVICRYGNVYSLQKS